MATRYYRPTTDEWVAANFSGGVLPADGDTIIFDAGSTKPCTNSMDRDGDSTGAGLNLGALIVEDGFAFDLGASGGPLQIAADIVILRGSGRVWLKASQGSGSAQLDDVVVACPRGTAIVLSDDATQVITRLAILGGDVTLAASMLAIDNLEIIGDPRLPPPVVTIGTSGTAIVRMYVGAGTVECDRAVTTYEQDGGNVNQKTGAFSNTTINAGTLKYPSTSTMAGRTTVKAGATLDLSEMRALTVTALYQQPGGIVLKPVDNSLVTFTKEFLYGQKVVN